jgi:CRISPR-associated helicase Cas3/CRISPR-associated endonuclease Cas3-HD
MSAMNIIYFAHSANPVGDRHPLSQHLEGVAGLACEFAKAAPWAGEARLAGLLHDLGKYADRFQARLRGEDAGLDHWSQGAWIALLRHRAKAAALAIQGHHVGLRRGDAPALKSLNPATLQPRTLDGLELSDPDPDKLERRAQADGLIFSTPAATALPPNNELSRPVAAMLDVRLLFSCLVDADFLDTDAHFKGDAKGKRYRETGPELDAPRSLAALDRYMAGLAGGGREQVANVKQARDSLWQSAGLAAELVPGIFTLTAPTGSGKTLAMLRFALQHAARHGLRRIVLAVPFLTVIEQTAGIYRNVFADFPENFVLEHHSLAGLGEESEMRDAEGAQERQRRLLAENWDAPIILTSNVQLLESLFSNRPSSCRKLHRLMNSVILFDEAQSLPSHLAVPTLAALSHLSSAYRTTVMFATATQPAFDALDASVQQQAAAGWKPTEAVPDHVDLFAALQRVSVRWPAAGEKLGWSELAGRLRDIPQALVVCNLKRHALTLLKELDGEDGVFHLSTNLCAEHRRAVLRTVRARLQAGESCRLISTQCVEAGVDVDFPTVYRAFAPLEAIAQAAGRCNREGRLNAHGKLGEVVVFEPAEDGDWRRHYPTRTYFQAAEVTRSLLAKTGELDIGNPETYDRYYRALYNVNDPASQSPELTEALLAMDFVEVARRYRLIDQGTIQVLVPWAARRDEFEQLRSEAEKEGISAHWMRRAQGLAVSVYRTAAGTPAWAIPAKLRWNKKGAGVSDEWFILEGDYYDDSIGLNPPDAAQIFIA